MAERPPEEIEAARKLFAGPCEFVSGAASVESLPPATRPEVAFAGRSNVGKSSLVNALTGRRTLARVSAKPGHTRQVNFFDLAERLLLVDLPGYGFAQVSRSMKETWQDLASAYLRGRPTLKRVCLLIDSRHGVKESDRETMRNLDSAAVSYQLILTKVDQLKSADVPRAIAAAEVVARKHGAAHPEVLPTSSESGFGIAELRAEIMAVAAANAASWKMMPKVKRSPSRRLETPWRIAVRCQPRVPFDGRSFTAKTTASPCPSGTTSPRDCMRGRCSTSMNSPPEKSLSGRLSRTVACSGKTSSP
jgi:GTP-binding protein